MERFARVTPHGKAPEILECSSSEAIHEVRRGYPDVRCLRYDEGIDKLVVSENDIRKVIKYSVQGGPSAPSCTIWPEVDNDAHAL